MAKPLIVFCDFDGTITEKDMVVRICEKFCPPVWRTIVEEILAQKKTVKEGVAEMFALIPSSKKDEVLHFALQTMRPRAGFQEFFAVLQGQWASLYCLFRRDRFFRGAANGSL